MRLIPPYIPFCSRILSFRSIYTYLVRPTERVSKRYSESFLSAKPLLILHLSKAAEVRRSGFNLVTGIFRRIGSLYHIASGIEPFRTHVEVGSSTDWAVLVTYFQDLVVIESTVMKEPVDSQRFTTVRKPGSRSNFVLRLTFRKAYRSNSHRSGPTLSYFLYRSFGVDFPWSVPPMSIYSKYFPPSPAYAYLH